MNHSSKIDARPSMQFYPSDWMAEPGLRLCGLASRGIWMDMLCLMWSSPERGVLRKQNGSKIESKDISKMCGASETEVDACLAELYEHGVYSKAQDGAIYNRRMVRDEHIRRVRSEAGSKGGRPSKAKAKHLTEKTPSSSTSTSTSTPTTIPQDLKGLVLYEADANLCRRWPELVLAWSKSYPGVNIPSEVANAHAWEVANPTRRKKDRPKFLNGWFGRKQDRGPSMFQSQSEDSCLDAHGGKIMRDPHWSDADWQTVKDRGGDVPARMRAQANV